MTERLYYTDPYRTEFDGVVARVTEEDGGRLLVTLDRTAFYPSSGGQPFDTGILGGLRVVDVIDTEDGDIVHVVTRDQGPGTDRGPRTLDQGQTVRGTIDWSRRFDHMQQHTGQHVLSAAVDKLFGVRTVSFHLGSDASTIDLARELCAAEIAAAEDSANRVVWEDRPVVVRFADAAEAARLPLRKESARTGELRLVDVDGFDLSACGGTHVARTGAVGVIAVSAWERFKGAQRLEFVCGGRALARFRAERDAIGASVRLLSVLPAELPPAIQRLQADAREQKRTIAALQEELASFRARELIDAAEASPVGRLVIRSIDADANGLKSLAAATTSRPGYIVVLTSSSRPVLIAVARSADVAAAASNQIVSALTARFGGRGGGRPDFAQAGGLDADPPLILDAARQLITAAATQG